MFPFFKHLNNHDKIKICEVCNIIILILLSFFRHNHRLNVNANVTDTISWRCHQDRVKQLNWLISVANAIKCHLDGCKTRSYQSAHEILILSCMKEQSFQMK